MSKKPEFEITSENGVGAEFEIEFGSIAVTDGRYFKVKGQLSSSIVLQDSDFFQKFSYEVITQTPINVWEGSLKKTVHPAGTKVFANVRLFDIPVATPSLILNSQFVVPPSYVFRERVGTSDRSVIWTDTYAQNYTFEDYVGDGFHDVTQSTPSTSSETLGL